MNETTISENVISIVDAKEIISSIPGVISRIENSKRSAEKLINNVSESSRSLQKAQNDDTYTRKVFGWSSETLLEFIIKSNNATHRSVSSISDLIKNSNENSRLLAEMIAKLAMLSALSFKNSSETTAQLEELALNFERQSDNNIGQAGQIKRVVLAHLNKIKEERIIADRIELNFEHINENLSALNQKIGAIEASLNSMKTEDIMVMEAKFNKKLQYLGALSFFTFLIFVTYFLMEVL